MKTGVRDRVVILVCGVVLAIVFQWLWGLNSKKYFFPRPEVIESSKPLPTVGGIYSVEDGDGYAVVKVLAASSQGVNISIYSGVTPERPKSIVPSSLHFESMYTSKHPGIMHIPISMVSFVSWKPQLLTTKPVTADEQSLVDDWRGASGKYLRDETPAITDVRSFMLR
jgi:hypothetical protein